MKQIYDQHKRWINIVKQFGIDSYAEDIVQEAYLKCYAKQKVNEAYFYLTLRSLVIDLIRKQKQITKISIEEITIKTETTQHNNEVLEIVENFHWFDKEVFYLHYDKKMSLNEISRKTGISLRTICTTIKRCNNKIIEMYEQR